jgi:hypothetical protein
MENSPTKERLKKRLKKRKEEKGIKDDPQQDNDLLTMISQVQKMLKTNPELVNKVSSCVNNLMGNKELINSLNQEFQKQVEKEETDHSQTLVASTSGRIPDADSK